MLGAAFMALGAAGMGLLAIGAMVTGSGGLADLLRLGVAVLFASVAVLVANPARRLGRATVEYAKAGLVTLAGGFAVTGLAYDTSFLTGAEDFLGVKALLLAPPALVAIVAAYRVLDRPRWSDTVTILNLEIRVWHMAALAVAGAAIAYLTLRSDNTGAAFDIELIFRQELENLLYVRPRTKEFLIGFPALVLAIVLTTRTRYGWWLFAVAAIGTASAIDTFTHFHAPLLASTDAHGARPRHRLRDRGAAGVAVRPRRARSALDRDHAAPMRLVVSGYYGYANAGDEAVLAGMLATFREADPDLEVTVLSGDPEHTRRTHGVAAIRRADLPAVARALRASDGLVSGGGSLLQDRTSPRPVAYYAGVMHLARFTGRPYAIHAQGLGPIRLLPNRWLAASALRGAAAVSLRDAASLDLARALGVRRHIDARARPGAGAHARPRRRAAAGRRRRPRRAGRRAARGRPPAGRGPPDPGAADAGPGRPSRLRGRSSRAWPRPRCCRPARASTRSSPRSVARRW